MTNAPAAIVRATKFLLPGQLVVSANPMEITTILGSCVAVCLWDRHQRIGGLNHFMLPLFSGSGSSSPRFGDVAMKQLLDGLLNLGSRAGSLQARVYGGACMFEPMRSATHLGRKNVDLALAFLERNGIHPVEIEIGGARGRKVIFRTDEGTTCLKSI